MIGNKKSIDIVVNLLKKNNIKKIVISPGGTNISLVKAVQDDDFFECYSVVDERSAVYFAIGLYLQSGEIIAMSCTSAQATRNYVPGLTEAYYKRVPLLAITMSKHPRFTYQEYMQAPNQTSLPEDCVKKSFELPFISDENDEFHAIRVANEAILEVTHHGKGPVQLCIPWLDFPLTSVRPQVRHIQRFTGEEVLGLDLMNQRIMVVVGEHGPFSAEEIKLMNAFAEKYDVMIYTNHLSNDSGKYALKANLAMLTMKSKDFAEEYKPNVVISIGGQTGDYPLYNVLSRVEYADMEHWRICDDGNVVDTYDKLTKIFEMSLKNFLVSFLDAQSDKSVQNHEFYKRWKNLTESRSTGIELPFSNAAIAQYLSGRMPSNSIIQFAILNSLRIWNLFALDASIECYSNVGAFGIDGGMSTLIGQSVATDKLCFMVTGDLAFFYDMNSLGIRHIKNNLRILLVNNDGGIEFKLHGGDSHSIGRYIAAEGHYKNAEGWARTCGFEYLSANNMEDFTKQADYFCGETEKPVLFEVFVKDSDEAGAYQLLIEKNKGLNLSDNLKHKIKNVLGNETVNAIKRVFK